MCPSRIASAIRPSLGPLCLGTASHIEAGVQPCLDPAFTPIDTLMISQLKTGDNQLLRICRHGR